MGTAIDSSQPAAEKKARVGKLEEFLDKSIRQGGFRFVRGKGNGNRIEENIVYPADKELTLEAHYDYDFVSKHLFYKGEIVAYLNRDAAGIGAQKKGKEYTLFVKSFETTKVYFEKEMDKAIRGFVSGAARMLKHAGLDDKLIERIEEGAH